MTKEKAREIRRLIVKKLLTKKQIEEQIIKLEKGELLDIPLAILGRYFKRRIMIRQYNKLTSTRLKRKKYQEKYCSTHKKEMHQYYLDHKDKINQASREWQKKHKKCQKK